MSNHRPLSTIAQEISNDPAWRKAANKNPSSLYAAKPYLEAMHDLDQITGSYGADSAKSVVRYFLSNAQSWRGETAKRIKAELRAIANPPLRSKPIRDADVWRAINGKSSSSAGPTG